MKKQFWLFPIVALVFMTSCQTTKENNYAPNSLYEKTSQYDESNNSDYINIETSNNEDKKKSYVFICRDTTRWELTDEQTTAYIDDFVNNYIPQFNEIGEYDRSEIRNGVDFGSVYLENIQLHVRLVSDNIYNIGILDTSKDVSDEGYEKLYLIPHEKLEELIETINAAKP